MPDGKDPSEAERADEHSPAILLSFDDGGTICFANARCEQWLGEDIGSLAGTPWDRLLTPGSRVFFSTHVFPLLQVRGTADQVYLQLRTRAGQELDVLLSAVRERDAERGARTHCVLMRMGQRRQLEAEILQAKAQAEEAARAKDHFLAVISHELRSPLSAILGWAAIGQAQKVDPAMRLQALNTIERNAKSQARLIDDLLDVSRISAGKLRVDLRPLDLDVIVRTALESVRPAAQAKGVRLSLQVEDDAHVVMADADRFEQIAWNLLNNAIKFTAKDGEVQVRLGRASSQVFLQVEDTGVGIAAEMLPFVFDRFWQSDNRTGNRSGLGLGLSICRSLVELHGGSIVAQSDGLGRGARFRVELPGVTAPAAPRADDHEIPSNPLLGLKLLVLDGDAGARQLLAALLESHGAELQTAATGAEAEACFRTQVPDVLVVDAALADADGFDFLRRLREREPASRRLPAIAITAAATPQERIRILRSGFQGHLAQPIDPVELVALVRSLASAQVT